MTAGRGQEETSRGSDSPDPLAPMWVAAAFLALSLFLYPFFAGNRAENSHPHTASKKPFTFNDLITFRDLNRTDVRCTEVLRAACTPYRDMYRYCTRTGFTSANNRSDNGRLARLIEVVVGLVALVGVLAVAWAERIFLFPLYFPAIVPFELAKEPPLLDRLRACWLALIPTGMLILNATGTMPIPLAGIYYLLLLHTVGALAFNAYALDKYAAICNEQTTEGTTYALDGVRQWFAGNSPLSRIPEAKLNGYVLIGGAAGAFLAQHLLQHKTSVRKHRFQKVFCWFLFIHCILTSAVYWFLALTD